MNRDDIFIGAIEVPNNDSFSDKQAYRSPMKGTEIVFEVDDLEAERDNVVAKGVVLDADIHMQEWGLRDFRLTGECPTRFLPTSTSQARKLT